MRKIREVLRLKFEQRLSNRRIAGACRVSATTVHDYLHRAKAAGLSWPLPPELCDDELERSLFRSTADSSGRVLPDFDRVSRELRRKNVTLMVLWLEYQSDHPAGYSYSRFCELYGEYSSRLEPRMRQTHKAGEKLFVDYAGQTVDITDRETGELRAAQVFVATLGASDYTYCEVTMSQRLEDWIGSHVRAFAFFGGVPEIVVPDNLKAGVNSPCYYDPELNPSYREMAAHYGVAVLPARIVKPRDKAKVENHVQHVERRILAPLRDQAFFSLDECNRAVARLLRELNDRPFQKMPGSRRCLFDEIEAPVLRPLPLEPYSFGYWKTARVNIDYHVAVEKSFYSVPYTLVRQQVDVRLSARTIEIFHKGQRIASHRRCPRESQHVTIAAHMPKSHRAYLEWTPERLAKWAGSAGPATRALVTTLMESKTHPQHAFRPCLGIMRLGQTFGSERLEAACARALATGCLRYRSIKSILDNELDKVPLHGDSGDTSELQLPLPIEHQNIRGADYYNLPAPDQSTPNRSAPDQSTPNRSTPNRSTPNRSTPKEKVLSC